MYLISNGYATKTPTAQNREIKERGQQGTISYIDQIHQLEQIFGNLLKMLLNKRMNSLKKNSFQSLQQTRSFLVSMVLGEESDNNEDLSEQIKQNSLKLSKLKEYNLRVQEEYKVYCDLQTPTYNLKEGQNKDNYIIFIFEFNEYIQNIKLKLKEQLEHLEQQIKKLELNLNNLSNNESELKRQEIIEQLSQNKILAELDQNLLQRQNEQGNERQQEESLEYFKHIIENEIPTIKEQIEENLYILRQFKTVEETLDFALDVMNSVDQQNLQNHLIAFNKNILSENEQILFEKRYLPNQLEQGFESISSAYESISHLE